METRFLISFVVIMGDPGSTFHTIHPGETGKMTGRHFARLASFVLILAVALFCISRPQSILRMLFYRFDFHMVAFLFFTVIVLVVLYIRLRLYYARYRLEMAEGYLLDESWLFRKRGMGLHEVEKIIETAEGTLLFTHGKKFMIHRTLKNVDDIKKELKQVNPDVEVVYHNNMSPVFWLNIAGFMLTLLGFYFSKKGLTPALYMAAILCAGLNLYFIFTDRLNTYLYSGLALLLVMAMMILGALIPGSF